jgi:hypothetical protein
MSDLDPPIPSPKKPHMPPIDLTLAVNFIPAVVCLCKAALISFSLNILDPGEHLGGFVVFVVVLNIDRAISCARIFDENAIQCCILAAWVINFLRAMAEAHKLVNPVATFFWLCFGYGLVLEPKVIQEFFVMYGHGSGGMFKRMLPGILTSIFVVVMAFTPMKEEPGIIRSARSVGFASLCVAWVYVVSVWRPKPRHNGSCVFECHLLLSRFCPILYIHWGVAICYAIGCVGLLVYHYIQIHISSPIATPRPLADEEECIVISKLDSKLDSKLQIDSKFDSKLQVESKHLSGVTVAMNEMNTIDTIEEDDEDIEAYFRSACQNRQSQ